MDNKFDLDDDSTSDVRLLLTVSPFEMTNPSLSPSSGLLVEYFDLFFFLFDFFFFFLIVVSVLFSDSGCFLECCESLVGGKE